MASFEMMRRRAHRRRVSGCVAGFGRVIVFYGNRHWGKRLENSNPRMALREGCERHGLWLTYLAGNRESVK